MCQQLMTKAIVMATEEMTEAMPLPVEKTQECFGECCLDERNFFLHLGSL